MVDGQLMHEYVHDQQFRESRGNCLTVRGLAIHLAELHKDSAGTPGKIVRACGCPIRWSISKAILKRAVRMNCSSAPRPCVWRKYSAAQFQRGCYGEPHRRTVVQFTPELRPCTADHFVLTFINNRQIKTEDFLHMENGAVIHRQRQEKKKGMLTQPYLGEKLP